MGAMRSTDHLLEVPVDHADPSGPTLTVYAREVCAPGGEDRPFLVFLQGGPGSESPRPNPATGPAWIGRALQDFRLLLLDQRGTGRSTPVGGIDAVPGDLRRGEGGVPHPLPGGRDRPRLRAAA